MTIETMTVTVRDRASEAPWGSPGLITPVTRKIVISANCVTCGQRRGEPQGLNSCDDGAFYWVQTWRNPCGHQDPYMEALAEARVLGVLGEQAGPWFVRICGEQSGNSCQTPAEVARDVRTLLTTDHGADVLAQVDGRVTVVAEFPAWS